MQRRGGAGTAKHSAVSAHTYEQIGRVFRQFIKRRNNTHRQAFLGQIIPHLLRQRCDGGFADVVKNGCGAELHYFYFSKKQITLFRLTARRPH